MNLYSVTLSGYRRFVDAWIALEGNVVAVVGPNEAGKSSLLDALELLNHDQRVHATSLTRGRSYPDAHEIVKARFRLTPEERSLAGWTPVDGQGLWLIIAKTVEGPRRFRIEPDIRRDRRLRKLAQSVLDREMGRPWFRRWEPASELHEEEEGEQALSREDFERLAAALKTGSDSLSSDDLDLLARAATAADRHYASGTEKSQTGLDGMRRLAAALRAASDHESIQLSSLVEELKQRVPQFVPFGEAARNLRSDYDLADPGQLNSPALRNFAKLARMSLEGLRDAVVSGDKGSRRSIQEAAQNVLADELKDAWKQAPLTVSFDRDATTLSITVSSHGTDYFALQDRSEGLKSFVALRAFLAQQEYPVPPILLVDEAETHLHYDAQADLVRVFEVQDQAAKVIYTTHSIGCLPQDLGRGVRVVTPEEGTRSSIENIWCREDAGVSPLMVAMGAATLPLTPSRYVAIGEGPSDAMLLPSLFREATGLGSLAFQVVAGLSEASDAELTTLDKEAPRVAYILDGDKAGNDLAKRLVGIGVPRGKIVRLSNTSTGMVLEDLIDPQLYADAVDQYLRSWPPYRGGFTKATLRSHGRPAALKAWCEANDVKNPSKLRIAEEILRIIDNPNPRDVRRLPDTAKIAPIRNIYARLLVALSIDA